MPADWRSKPRRPDTSQAAQQWRSTIASSSSSAGISPAGPRRSARCPLRRGVGTASAASTPACPGTARGLPHPHSGGHGERARAGRGTRTQPCPHRAGSLTNGRLLLVRARTTYRPGQARTGPSMPVRARYCSASGGRAGCGAAASTVRAVSAFFFLALGTPSVWPLDAGGPGPTCRARWGRCRPHSGLQSLRSSGGAQASVSSSCDEPPRPASPPLPAPLPRCLAPMRLPPPAPLETPSLASVICCHRPCCAACCCCCCCWPGLVPLLLLTAPAQGRALGPSRPRCARARRHAGSSQAPARPGPPPPPLRCCWWRPERRQI